MTFGLCNAPATFQRLMELALKGLQWTDVMFDYLDDVIVFGDNMKEHANQLREVLERIRQAKFKLKPEKCNLCAAKTEFLGNTVLAEVIRLSPTLMAKIQQLPVPEKV